MAVEAATMSEAEWLAMFGFVEGAAWPAGFACTAVDAATGRYQLWDGRSGVTVQRAVASSCAVPGMFPPVTIDGGRWMDGGVRDMLNADAAAGHDVVVAVSCTLIEIPPELSTPELDAMFGATRGRLEELRRAGAGVEVVVPNQEMLEISGWGMNLMDFTAAGAAYQAGLRQGRSEAARLAALWNT
jgi:NTE family protein